MKQVVWLRKAAPALDVSTWILADYLALDRSLLRSDFVWGLGGSVRPL